MDVALAIAAAFAFAALLYVWSAWYCGSDRNEASELPKLVAGALLLRAVLHLTLIRNFSPFSHDGGGDSFFYERIGIFISKTWQTTGIRFVTADELPAVGSAALVPNALALIHYMIGGSPAPLGTVVLAVPACATTVLLYRLARDEGASVKAANWMAGVLLFSPCFVYYTSDVYKDGLVLFFTVASVVTSLRMAHDTRISHILVILASFAGLWFVRRYMVFACLGVPLISFTVGRGNMGTRTLIVVGGAVTALVAGASLFTESLETAETLFEQGTSNTVMNANALGGSGITFSGGPGEFPLRIAYTLLSPFPWMSGSVALHIGKLDALLLTVTLWLSLRSTPLLMRERRSFLFGLMTFIIPATMAYAAGVSNIGLIVRQRMPIVACLTCVAAVGRSLSRRAELRPRVDDVPVATT